MHREIRERILTVGAGGGLILAPTHMLEPDVPWENVEAFIQAARKFGRGIKNKNLMKSSKSKEIKIERLSYMLILNSHGKELILEDSQIEGALIHKERQGLVLDERFKRINRISAEYS